MGLGSIKDFSFKEARERARAKRQLLADGVDPIEAKISAKDAAAKEARERLTFKQATDDFLTPSRQRLEERQASRAMEKHP